MKDITLHLTIDETNIILEALGDWPYIRVRNVIGKIHIQAQQQNGQSELTAVEVEMPE